MIFFFGTQNVCCRWKIKNQYRDSIFEATVVSLYRQRVALQLLFEVCEKSYVKMKPILEYKRALYCSGGDSSGVGDDRTSRPVMGDAVFLIGRFALKLHGLIQHHALKFGRFGHSVAGVVEITRGFSENRPRPDTGCAPQSSHRIGTSIICRI